MTISPTRRYKKRRALPSRPLEKMLLLLHGPSGPFHVVATADGRVYWRERDVFRALYLDQRLGKRLVGEDYVYACELGATHRLDHYLTADRVRHLFSRAAKRLRFRDWFEDVSSGRSLLCPRDPDHFDFCVRMEGFGAYGGPVVTDCTNAAVGLVRLGYVFDLPNLAAMATRPPPDPRDLDELLARELDL